MNCRVLVFGVLACILSMCGCAEKEESNQKDKVDPVTENMYNVLQKEIQGTENTPLFLSVVNPNDCVMCYGPISRYFSETKTKHEIDSANVIMVLPALRERQVDALFDRYIRMEQSNFAQIVRSNQLFDFVCQNTPNINTSTSFAVVVNTYGKIVFAKEYKLMNEGVVK
jgi:hypothetical protein